MLWNLDLVLLSSLPSWMYSFTIWSLLSITINVSLSPPRVLKDKLVPRFFCLLVISLFSWMHCSFSCFSIALHITIQIHATWFAWNLIRSQMIQYIGAYLLTQPKDSPFSYWLEFCSHSLSCLYLLVCFVGWLSGKWQNTCLISPYRTNLVFASMCLASVLLFKLGAITELGQALLISAISCRITGNYVLYTLIQRHYKGNDWAIWIWWVLMNDMSLHPHQYHQHIHDLNRGLRFVLIAAGHLAMKTIPLPVPHESISVQATLPYLASLHLAIRFFQEVRQNLGHLKKQ